MKNLKAKLNKQGGFTLIEMLIVVAIIAILIAVSIPLVNSSLERARESTDAANERSFKAVLTIAYANGKYDLGTPTGSTTTAPFTAGTVYCYDAITGAITDTTSGKGYGKSTAYDIVDDVKRKGQYLFGTYDEAAGAVVMRWNPTKPKNLTALKGLDDNLIYTKMVSEA